MEKSRKSKSTNQNSSPGEKSRKRRVRSKLQNQTRFASYSMSSARESSASSKASESSSSSKTRERSPARSKKTTAKSMPKMKYTKLMTERKTTSKTPPLCGSRSCKLPVTPKIGYCQLHLYLYKGEGWCHFNVEGMPCAEHTGSEKAKLCNDHLDETQTCVGKNCKAQVAQVLTCQLSSKCSLELIHCSKSKKCSSCK